MLPGRERYSYDPRLRWHGESGFGSEYGSEEREALLACLDHAESWRDRYEPVYLERFEDAFAARVGARFAIAVNSGGTALELCLRALHRGPGDEVITCAVNFPGTHVAVIGAGYRLVLAEPELHGLNIDVDDVADRLTRNTRVVLVTHMNGSATDVSVLAARLARTAAALGIETPAIIEDAARALGAETPAGRVGSGVGLTAFSFHRKKIISTLGEGGMITTGSAKLAAAVRRFRGFGNGISWGGSFKLTEFQAAVGLVQLERLDNLVARRRHLALARTVALSASANVRTPVERHGFRDVYYLYSLLLEGTCHQRDLVMQRLNERGVGSVVANPPSYLTNRFIRRHLVETGQQLPLPRAEDVGGRLFCPALDVTMSDADNEYVSASIEDAVRAVCGAA